MTLLVIVSGRAEWFRGFGCAEIDSPEPLSSLTTQSILTAGEICESGLDQVPSEISDTLAEVGLEHPCHLAVVDATSPSIYATYFSIETISIL
ncbi:hypothetical protein CIK61_02045 [Brevibacterium aurantiacum]|nr:hypothetical protein CIK61_02045 [Brevibacterium aurantiacum]